MSHKQNKINIAKTVIVLKECKVRILLTTLLTTLLAIIYCFVATPIFTARVVINPPKLSDAGTSFSQAISGLAVLGGGGSGLLAKTDADIAIAMLRTNVAKNMVIDKFNLMRVLHSTDKELARDALSPKIKFITDVKSGFLTLEVNDKDPKLAADIANYYTIVLGQLINNIAFARANQRHQFYREQLITALKSLNDSESQLKMFSRKNGIIAGQQTQVISNIAAQLQLQLVSGQLKLQSLEYYFSKDSADYQSVLASVNSYKAQLDKLNNQNTDDNISIPAGLAPDMANEYLNLMRDFTFKELVYNMMLRQSKASQLDAQSEISPLAIQVVDPALVPLYKSAPNRRIIALFGFLVGLVVSSLYFLIRRRNFIIFEE